MSNFRNVQRATIRPLNKIVVSGYKSLNKDKGIEIHPLTLLAGANSSGKSSIMQILLLLKQTLESPYDSGALKIDGPIVKFSKVSQLFFNAQDTQDSQLRIKLHFGETEFGLHFSRGAKSGIDLIKNTWSFEQNTIEINAEMSAEEIKLLLISNEAAPFVNLQSRLFDEERNMRLKVIRDRCFLDINVIGLMSNFRYRVAEKIESIIHVPGLRGNPTRDYAIGAVGRTFPGTFENYTASIISKWQDENSEKLNVLAEWLKRLGLTWKVEARPIDDIKVELRIGRTRNPPTLGRDDMVNVADVGFGVSQTLPVLVALLTAEPGQIVYIEQPEIHLHPRAQVAMAKILAEAAQRGVRVVAETHSSLLLTGIQTLVAEDNLDRNLVKLHWFTRDEDSGETTIQSADLDETGAFGDWPEDFDDVALETEGNYIKAAQLRLAQRNAS